MIICAPTIMHTGTHLLRFEVLKEKSGRVNTDVYNFIGIKPLVYKLMKDGHTKITDDAVLGGHLINSLMDVWEEAFSEGPVITTLRHPARVWESFKRRNESRRFYEEQWKNMIEVVAKYNPYYLHIDSDVKDIQLDIISRVVGKDLKTDWPVSKETGAHFGTHAIDIKHSDIPADFIDFYYETQKWCKEQKTRIAS